MDDPLADGLALHAAICDAVSPGAASGDWYGHHPQREDGGYLAALVAACQEEVARTAGHRARAAARSGGPPTRCGEGQSHTHAAARAGADELEALGDAGSRPRRDISGGSWRPAPAPRWRSTP